MKQYVHCPPLLVINSVKSYGCVVQYSSCKQRNPSKGGSNKSSGKRNKIQVNYYRAKHSKKFIDHKGKIGWLSPVKYASYSGSAHT